MIMLHQCNNNTPNADDLAVATP